MADLVLPVMMSLLLFVVSSQFLLSVQGLTLRLKGRETIPNDGSGEVDINDLPVGGVTRYETLECLSDVKYRGRQEEAYWIYTDNTLSDIRVDDLHCTVAGNCNHPDIGWWSVKSIYKMGRSYYGTVRLGRRFSNVTRGIFTCVYRGDSNSPVTVFIYGLHTPPPDPTPTDPSDPTSSPNPSYPTSLSLDPSDLTSPSPDPSYPTSLSPDPSDLTSPSPDPSYPTSPSPDPTFELPPTSTPSNAPPSDPIIPTTLTTPTPSPSPSPSLSCSPTPTSTPSCSPIMVNCINSTHTNISWDSAFSQHVDLYNFLYVDETGLCHCKQFCRSVRSYVINLGEVADLAIEAHSCNTYIVGTQSTSALNPETGNLSSDLKDVSEHCSSQPLCNQECIDFSRNNCSLPSCNQE